MEVAARSAHLTNKGVSRAPQVDWGQILAAKNSFTSRVPENTVNTLKGHGVTFVPGQAVFVDATTVAVDKRRLTAPYLVIATGAKPMTLPFAGAEHLITSTDFLELPGLPRRIAFVGGGFISFEFAHFAARLGAHRGDIHILESRDRPLGPFDAGMVAQLVEASTAEGICLHTAISIRSVEKNGNDFTIHFESGDSLKVDLVVNGAGRVANIDSLNLEAAGVRSDRGGIAVDKRMRTSQPHIFAVGDCAATVQLARVADMEGLVAAGAITAAMEGTSSAGMDYDAVPALLFTYPQLGMIGRTEQQLQAESMKYYSSSETSISWPTYRRVGLRHAAYKILVDEHNLLLGAHFLSDNAAGLLAVCRQAMLHGVSADRLHRQMTMSPYPSRESDLIYMLSPFVE